MKLRSIHLLTLAALIAALCATLVTAQTKPNFSGTWKMNSQKSKFGGGGGPEGILIKIDHKEPAWVEDWSISTPNGERAFQAKYSLDGKETDQEVMGRTAKTSAKWVGAALLIEWKTDNGMFNRKITLSADGKTMTKVVTHTEGGNQQEDTVVFDKQ